MPTLDLVADCGNCAALCCVWTAFDASEDFAFTKPAGVTCRYLSRDDRCTVHDELAARGLGGCAAYDCHGAGPHATRLFAGMALTRRERHDVFLTLREVHELAWVLGGALRLCDAGPLRDELSAALADLEVSESPAQILGLDLAARRAAARALLRRVRQAHQMCGASR
jgi:hypothetical protein